MSLNTHPAVTCAENVALLHLLHSVPALPSRNQAGHSSADMDEYSLSFRQERSLTGTLAFLAGLKDGPEDIPALCIYEDKKSRAVKVLIAVNKAKPSDGDVTLREIKTGFDRLFAVLGQIEDGEDNSSRQAAIYSTVIGICSTRILCRLRFIPTSRGTMKQPLKTILQEAVTYVHTLREDRQIPQLLWDVSTQFLDESKRTIRLIDAWRKHQVPVRLEKMVSGIHDLHHIGQLKLLFDDKVMSNKVMDVSKRKNLLNMLSKIARYKEASRFLFRLTRKIPLLRHMRAEMVQLTPEMFQAVTIEETLDLSTTFDRIRTLGQQSTLSINQVCHFQKVNVSEAETTFAARTRETLRHGKIHAEIQLLSFLTLNELELPPRVICSSKDACFLCNLCIKTLGQIHVPRSHGRLYPGWRLPNGVFAKTIERRFNSELEAQILDSIAIMLDRRDRPGYKEPWESNLLTLPYSASTLVTEVRAETSEVPGAINLITAAMSQNGSKSNLAMLPVASLTASGNNAVKIQLEKTPADDGNDRSYEYYMRPGEEILITLEPGGISKLYTTGKLELQLECSTPDVTDQLTEATSKVSYIIKWLIDDLVSETPASLNAETLIGEMRLSPDDQGRFWVTAGGDHVKIQRISI